MATIKSNYDSYNITKNNMWTNENLIVNDTLKQIFKTSKVLDKDNKEHKFHAGVNPIEGRYLYDCVKDNLYNRVLEIGCAYGTSGLYFTQAFQDNNLDDAKLRSIDPMQSTMWMGIGKLNIERANLGKYFKLIEEKSYLAMPLLLNAKKKYDLIFIDGMHLFDYTLLDLFFADQLTKVGGLILLDDIRHRGVNKAYNYILKNYKHWRLIKYTPCSDTLATFIKLKEEEIGEPGSREWFTHHDF
jgi:predicted O-methyltransferase YrrM